MSAYRVALHFRFSLYGDKFCNIDNVPHMKSQTIILHGTHDEIVPFWHGQELHMAVEKKYRFRPYWAQNAGHNNIEAQDTKTFFKRLGHFLDAIS